MPGIISNEEFQAALAAERELLRRYNQIAEDERLALQLQADPITPVVIDIRFATPAAAAVAALVPPVVVGQQTPTATAANPSAAAVKPTPASSRARRQKPTMLYGST